MVELNAALFIVDQSVSFNTQNHAARPVSARRTDRRTTDYGGGGGEVARVGSQDSNATPGERRAIVIGATASHAFAAGWYRSTVFIGPSVSSS